jgi:hypothetical protein
MNDIQQIQQTLAQTGLGAANQINKYVTMCVNGQLSVAECKSLVLDIQRQLNIDDQLVDQDHLNTINTAINALIDIVNAVG